MPRRSVDSRPDRSRIVRGSVQPCSRTRRRAEPAVTDVFLERDFDPPFTPGGVNRLMDKYGWCFDLYKVDWQLSCLSTDGTHMLCWFKGPDAEAARNAVRKFGGDVRKLWIGEVHEARDGDVPVANLAVE